MNNEQCKCNLCGEFFTEHTFAPGTCKKCVDYWMDVGYEMAERKHKTNILRDKKEEV